MDSVGQKHSPPGQRPAANRQPSMDPAAETAAGAVEGVGIGERPELYLGERHSWNRRDWKAFRRADIQRQPSQSVRPLYRYIEWCFCEVTARIERTIPRMESSRTETTE